MNRIYLSLVASAILYLGACGPANYQDPMTKTRLGNNAAAEVSAPDDAAPADTDEDEGDDAKKAPDAVEEPKMKEPEMKEPEIKPETEVRMPAVEMSAPMIKLPTRLVFGVNEYQRNAPQVIKSEQEINYEQDILHRREIHKFNPVINHLHTNKVLNLKHKYFTKVFNHASSSNSFSGSQQVVESSEVMPIEEVEAPVVSTVNCNYGAYGYGAYRSPYGYGYGGYRGAYGYRPYRGFYRGY